MARSAASAASASATSASALASRSFFSSICRYANTAEPESNNPSQVGRRSLMALRLGEPPLLLVDLPRRAGARVHTHTRTSVSVLYILLYVCTISASALDPPSACRHRRRVGWGGGQGTQRVPSSGHCLPTQARQSRSPRPDACPPPTPPRRRI